MSTEFPRPLAVARISAGGLGMTVTADAAERAALAERFKLPAIAALRCRFQLRPAPGDSYEAEGELAAHVTQLCVVTLEPFETEIKESFRVRFVPEGAETEDEDPDAIDEIPYTNDTLDLGEAAAEQLALALDPYPRKPGAELEMPEGQDQSHPFAGLARLRRPQ